MPLYRPIRTTASAVPDALAGLRSDISTLASATSGQINGTTAKLKAMVEQLAEQVRVTPAVYALHTEVTNWATASAGGTEASVSMTVPSGKYRAQVFASASGMSTSDGIHSHQPAFQIQIGSALSPALPSIPDNQNTFHLLGSYSASLDVTPGQTLTVSLILKSGTVLTTAAALHNASLDAYYAFTN